MTKFLKLHPGWGFQSNDLEENICFIAQKTDTPPICKTLEKHDSIMLSKARYIATKDILGY